MLALVFGIQRFHTYLYARPLTIVTDHKPLVNITDKPIHSAPPRLQRMLMQIQLHCKIQTGQRDDLSGCTESKS